MADVTLDRFIKSIDHSKDQSKDISFYWTGHPFVDAGLTALLLITGKKKPKDLTFDDIKKAIDFVSKIYARKEWASKYLHGMIFPNSGILMANPSMSKKRSPESIAKNLFDLYNSI